MSDVVITHPALEATTVYVMWESGKMVRQKILTHSNAECDKSLPCPLHAPSGHSLNGRPLAIERGDYDLMFRICQHDSPHPDPDSVTYLGRAQVRDRLDHKCDGCCSR